MKDAFCGSAFCGILFFGISWLLSVSASLPADDNQLLQLTTDNKTLSTLQESEDVQDQASADDGTEIEQGADEEKPTMDELMRKAKAAADKARDDYNQQLQQQVTDTIGMPAVMLGSAAVESVPPKPTLATASASVEHGREVLETSMQPSEKQVSLAKAAADETADKYNKDIQRRIFERAARLATGSALSAVEKMQASSEKAGLKSDEKMKEVDLARKAERSNLQAMHYALRDEHLSSIADERASEVSEREKLREEHAAAAVVIKASKLAAKPILATKATTDKQTRTQTSTNASKQQGNSLAARSQARTNASQQKGNSPAARSDARKTKDQKQAQIGADRQAKQQEAANNKAAEQEKRAKARADEQARMKAEKEEKQGKAAVAKASAR